MDSPVYVQMNSPFLIESKKLKNIYDMSFFHYHNAYEIYYQMQGERNYFIENKVFYIRKGDVIFIKMNDLHRSLHCPKNNLYYKRIAINFKPEFFQPLAEMNELDNLLQMESGVFHLDSEKGSIVEKMISHMLTEQERRPLHSELYIRTLLLQLLVILNRSTSQLNVQEKPDNKNILNIAKYLSENYQQKITLSQLGRNFFLSESYLSRSFKQVTGVNIISYLNVLRVKQAQALLSETNKTITEIAYSVGYENLTHFERVFKSVTALSPLKYRKLN